DPGASVESTVHRSNLHVEVTVFMPVMLRACSVIHVERTKETPVLVPFPTHAVESTVAKAQLLREVSVSMPGARNAVTLAAHLPYFLMNLAAAVIKSLGANI